MNPPLAGAHVTQRRVVIVGLFTLAAAGTWWLWQRPAPSRMVAGPEQVDDCEAERSVELRTLCLVQVAGTTGARGDADEVSRACDRIDGFWAEECHFRGGEELAKAGRAASGLEHCAQSGRFARFCLSHVAWGRTPLDLDYAQLPALAAPFASLPALPLDTPAEDTLRARWWFDRVYGSGVADPTLARAAAPIDAPHARGAWALEAVRLLEGNVEHVLGAWSSATPLSGTALPRDRRLGRYDLPFDIPGESALPRIPTFGGGKRFVAETVEADVLIATLEAAYFWEFTTGAVFSNYLGDPRPLVRYTALRCFRTLMSPNVESVLQAMSADPDPIVAAHVADALKFRTWEGKRSAPGLRTQHNPG